MDPFIPLTLGAVILLVLVFMGLARAFQGHGVDELLDWKPTRDYETEVELEQDDVQQMIDAQNEIRRRRGLPERDEDEIAASVQRHREELREQARRYADPGA